MVPSWFYPPSPSKDSACLGSVEEPSHRLLLFHQARSTTPTACQQPRGAGLSKALVSLCLRLMSRAWGEPHPPCRCFGLLPLHGKALPGLSLAQQKQYRVPSQHPANKETAESFYCYRPCLAQVTQRVTAGQQGPVAQSVGGMSSHSK